MTFDVDPFDRRPRPTSTFEIHADTEPGLEAQIVLGRLRAGVDIVVLALGATGVLGFGSDIHPAESLWRLRSRIRIESISYSNPLNEVLMAQVGKAAANKAAGLIETLGTIGLERAERRERVRRLRHEAIVRDVTLEWDVDDRIALSQRLELENQALELENKRRRFDFALDIIEAQTRHRARDGVTGIWTLEFAMEALDPKNSENDVVPGIRDLQSIDATIFSKGDGDD